MSTITEFIEDRLDDEWAHLGEPQPDGDAPENTALTDLELGRRLRDARHAANLTQEEVVKALIEGGFCSGLAYSAVLQIERGARSVRVLELIRLAELYGVEIEELIR